MLLVFTFSIILIAAIISIAITAYCHAAVSSFHETCTTEELIKEDASEKVKQEILKESVNNQQVLVFPSQPLGELKVERG